MQFARFTILVRVAYLTSGWRQRTLARMFVRLGHIFLISALLAATGGHWAILQCVAWTTMLADNLRTDSLSESWSKTFDGRHPCDLCKQIASSKQTEKKSQSLAPIKKLDFVSLGTPIVFAPPNLFSFLPDYFSSSRERSRTPPTPPPRVV